MKIEGLRYIMLASSDIERSIAFYRDKLRLELVDRTRDEFVHFNCGNAEIVVTTLLRHLLDENARYPMEIVLGVPSVTQAYDELCERGVTFLKPPRQIRPDAWATNCKDPDGYFVSIYGPQ
jgi:catechol 2,3-dioxygenase-like lactoylglutathione lyase family enzyme